ncbi:MAG: hypothetical protein M1831_006082 [Alyxoria varia]|nr:MAG: hypothetical protein M1831_006082 [Alyxoria varia]
MARKCTGHCKNRRHEGLFAKFDDPSQSTNQCLSCRNDHDRRHGLKRQGLTYLEIEGLYQRLRDRTTKLLDELYQNGRVTSGDYNEVNELGTVDSFRQIATAALNYSDDPPNMEMGTLQGALNDVAVEQQQEQQGEEDTNQSGGWQEHIPLR